MTIEKAYTCPTCGKKSVNVEDIEQIFKNARAETSRCMECGTKWVVYYKMTDINVKLLGSTKQLVNTNDENVLEIIEKQIDEAKYIE